MVVLVEDLHFIKEKTQPISEGWGTKTYYSALGSYFTYTAESTRFSTTKERARVIFRLYANSRSIECFDFVEGSLVMEFDSRFTYEIEKSNYRKVLVNNLSLNNDDWGDLRHNVISHFKSCLVQEFAKKQTVEVPEDLSTAQFAFMLKRIRLNHDSKKIGKLYQANTKQHFITAVKSKNLVSFTLYTKSDHWMRSPLYYFTYDLEKNTIPKQKKELNLPPASWTTKQTSDFQWHAIIRFTHSLELEAARPRYEIETDTPVSSPSPVKSKKETSLALERVKTAAKIAESKEIILRSVYQLNSMERIKFVKIWEEYEELLSSSENLVTELTSTTNKSVGSRLQSIHDRMSKMAAKVLYQKHKPKATKEMQLLIHEIKQMGDQVQSNLTDSDIIANHQCSTILSDTKKLIKLYEESESEERTRLDALVMEGLTEAVQKLQVLVTVSMKKEERAIERQVLLLKQR